MNDRLVNAFQKFNELLDRQRFAGSELDYSILEYHRPMLERLDVINSSSITIFDLYKRDHIYISNNFEKVFGYSIEEAEKEGTGYFNRHIHPDDIVLLTEAGVHFMELFFVVPRNEVKHHKMLTDYRMYKSDGSMIRVVEQQLCLEFDKRGNLWLALSFLDISPNQDLNLPAQARLLNFQTGKLYDFPPVNEQASLTRREKEILGMLSQGLISKQIADQLFISINTVNTHRQRILEKLRVTNTAEAIQYGLKLGVL